MSMAPNIVPHGKLHFFFCYVWFFTPPIVSLDTDQRVHDIWWWATRKIYRSLRWQCKLARRKDFPNFKKENDDMLGIFVMMNLTWVVISQERASLSVLKDDQRRSYLFIYSLWCFGRRLWKLTRVWRRLGRFCEVLYRKASLKDL